MSIIEMHLIVHGLVQGVGYRATAARHARALELSGTARNLDDGSVELFVQGEREKITQFMTLVSKEAGAAQVHHMAAEEISPPHTYQGFKIIY